MNNVTELKIAIIGMGYVGLPLALEFGRQRNVIGFDISAKRIAELRQAKDTTLEATQKDFEEAKHLQFTDNLQDIAQQNCYIVTVPTPINQNKSPDLSFLLDATRAIASVLKPGDFVIYESTVYPGCTDEVCAPTLEEVSGLKLNEDFWCGYSPERINPGDKSHRLTDIIKVTSGSSPEAAQVIDALYAQIISAGTHPAPSICVAEAAKVIENTQRDLNIALMNELSIIFSRLDLDTHAVIEAASTKWNFMPFKPGLVGGHCIGVDPYYLTFKAQAVGYEPNIILAGRNLNDSMGRYVVSNLIKAMTQKNIPVIGSRILIMGYTFKENCPDTRNTGVEQIVRELLDYQCSVAIYDPWVNPADLEQGLKELVVSEPEENAYDAVVMAVGHKQFEKLGTSGIQKLCKEQSLFYDLKSVFSETNSDFRL